MPSPYALDFSPITDAIRSNRLLDLQRERQAMEQERLGMETEKFDWARGDEEAKRAAGAVMAQNPNAPDFAAARAAAYKAGNLEAGSALYGTENTATALENAKRYRDETAAVSGLLPRNAAQARPGGAAPTANPFPATKNPMPFEGSDQAADAFAPGGLGRKLAARTADFFKSQILDPSLPPAVAEQRYNAFRSQPDLAPHFEAGGYGKGDWRSEAQHVYADAAARAAGAPPPPRYAPTAAASSAPQDVPKAPGSQGAALPPADRDAIIRAVAAEARGEGPQGWQAVAAVIMNRSKSSGLSPSAVISAPGQFEGTKAPIFSQLKPGDPLYDRIAQSIDPVLSGEAPDVTGGATHFFAPGTQAALGRQPPAWAQGQPGTDIGNQRFFKIGYHFVIRRDGTVETGRKLDEIGAHVEGHNSESIGICLVGGVEKKEHAVRAPNGELVSLVAKDNFTLDQKHALAMQLTGLLHQFPNAEVLGHRDFPGVKKDCPCFDVREWWRSTATHPDLT